ncbi:hypothetical protein TCON_1654 [Astathelohania contejeani]|uniref:Proliferating cell nuclear antigen n=1 Tax=Astathelohania contejeani TaxID=164912 RepID=A0ABQ7HY87_9MICR|nr:hypothetical protein TCON_1654 [Thelohania contejeani]
MECILIPESAKFIDKIIKDIAPISLVISISDSMLIQLVSCNNSLLTNVKLKDNFFEYFSVEKEFQFAIPKINFYMKNMRHLKLNLTEYLMKMEWKFDEYTYKREVYISDSSLQTILFQANHLIRLDHVVMMEMLKHFKCNRILLSFKNKFLKIANLDGKNKISASIEIDTDMNENVEVPLANFKKAFSCTEFIDSFTLCYEDGYSPLNFVINNSEYDISYFIAIFS